MCDVDAKSKADSLWIGMMDICKRFGISPSLIDELFGYVKPFREMELENARLRREVGRLHADLYGKQDGSLIRDQQQRIEELEGESINYLAEKVCKEIPEFYEIQVCMENGAGYVTLTNSYGYIEFDNVGRSIKEQVEEALHKAKYLGDKRNG